SALKRRRDARQLPAARANQTTRLRRPEPTSRQGGARRSAQRDRAGGTREPGDRGIAPFPSIRRVRATVRAGAARDHQEMPHGVGMDKGTAPRADRGMDQTTTQTSLKRSGLLAGNSLLKIFLMYSSAASRLIFHPPPALVALSSSASIATSNSARERFEYLCASLIFRSGICASSRIEGSLSFPACSCIA